MNETDCLKICRCIEKLWNNALMPQKRCAFVYTPPNCVGHVVWSNNISLENAIKMVHSPMHFNSAVEYFNYMKTWYMQYEPSVVQQSLMGKLFTMSIEQLMVLADMHVVE